MTLEIGIVCKKKSNLVSLGFAGRVPINEDGIGFHFHRIGKAQGTTCKSYSPSEAWKESCVTYIWHRVPQWDIWWIAYEITFMKLNLILEQKYRQHTFQLIFLQAPRTESVGVFLFYFVSQTDYLLNSSNNYPFWLWSVVTSGITPPLRRAGCQLPSNERSGLMKSFLDDLTNYLLVSDLPFWVRLLGKLSKVTQSQYKFILVYCNLRSKLDAAQRLYCSRVGKSST